MILYDACVLYNVCVYNGTTVVTGASDGIGKEYALEVTIF